MKREWSPDDKFLLHRRRKVRRSIYSVTCRRRWMSHWWDTIDDDTDWY